MAEWSELLELSWPTGLSVLSSCCNCSNNSAEAAAGAPCFCTAELRGSIVSVTSVPYPVCAEQTHLLFGLALSLSDVSGDDSLGLFPQSRKWSQLQMHTNKTHTYTAAGIEVTHTFSGFRGVSTVYPPQRNYTPHIKPNRRQRGHQGDGGHTDSPSECDSDTVRAKSRIIRLVRVKSEEREREREKFR